MDKKEKNKKRSYKGWIIAAIVLVIVLVSGRFLLKSDWLFDKLRDMAIEQANQQLSGDLSVGSIRGDVLNGFIIRDVSLRDTVSTEVIQIDSVDVKYHLFSVLFSPHTVESVEVFGTDILVEQHADSSWNVLGLMPPAEEPEEESDSLYWFVENIVLSDTNIEVRSEQYLPDDVLFVERIFTNLSAGMLETGISGNLRELQFSIREGRLPEPVDVYLSGEARQDQYTLNSIVINTGRSVLEGYAQYEEDGEIEQNLQFSPLSWRDISEFAAQVPIEQNLQIELSADGTLDDLRLAMNVHADGLEQLHIQATSGLRDSISLKQLRISIENLNAPLLTGDETTPVIESLNVQGDGNIWISSPDDSDWIGAITIENAAFQPYEIDLLNTNYTLQNGSLELDGNLRYQNEEIVLAAGADSLFGRQPEWRFYAESNQINPGTWLQDEEYAGRLNIVIDAKGAGFDTADFSSTADITVTDSRIYGQPFSRLSFSGNINPERLDGKLSGRLEESTANINFTLSDWQNIPEYQFILAMNRLNFAEVNGFEEFPTYLNGTIKGQGTSFDPEQMRMKATANFDSSIVNGEEVQELHSDFRIENQFLIVDDGLLESPIADASFSLNQHLFDITNRENRLNFQASVKDLMPLAPLVDAETLQSEGSINGNIGRNSEGMLEFKGEFNLENVAVDTLFSADLISGNVVSFITDEPHVDLNVKFSEPSVNQIGVQDIQLYVYANIKEEETSGNMILSLKNGDDSLLRHTGDFSIDSTRTRLLTQSLDFQTSRRELTLEKPFYLMYSNNTLRVDTLTISTEEGNAHLSLWAPRVDSLIQQGGLDAQNLNVGVLQQTLLKESYFDGYLNGFAEVYNSPDSLQASVSGFFTELKYSDGEMDSLRTDLNIKEEWLTAELDSWHETKKMAEGSFRVPFLPGDPRTFDDQFFEREIDGRFEVYESELDYWFSFLPEGVPEATSGLFSLQTELGGIAGNPDLDGTINITEGTLSGIDVDSVGFDIGYFHEEEKIDLNGFILKERRRILDFEASLPFLVDLKNAEINLPSNSDEVFADIKTNNFDLALFNSYVNRDLVRGLSGRMEGNVTLSGVMDNLQTNGEMRLTRGSLRVIPAGITVNEISSTFLFRQNSVELQQFSARSGPGRLRASGNMDLENLETGRMNINITANQFRLLNTSDYNAIINLDTRLTGTTTEPRLKGNLTFLNGFYFLQDFGDRTVEDVELDDEEGEETYDFYEALDMEMTVGIGRQFIIRNRQYLDMEIELDGEVDLVKEPHGEMQIFGTLEGVDGYAQPLGKQFELEEGLVSFYGPADNPELNVRSSYKPPQAGGVEIFYIIEGTLHEPEFRFDSQPQLELQDIISYTLFGRPFYELESWEQVVAGSNGSPSAADYAMEVLLDRVEMLASQRLGIDVVQIDNSRSGSNNTVIKTGWYLSQRTFFAILNEIDGSNPKTLFVLEILLRDNLELIITQGDDTRQGIDLQWKLDY